MNMASIFSHLSSNNINYILVRTRAYIIALASDARQQFFVHKKGCRSYTIDTGT
jgi:hypothetical protein